MEALSLKDFDVKRERRASFARGMAAEAFGGRYFGWREWAEFEDLDAETIERRRFAAVWSR